MPPSRTPLGSISGNRRFNYELTPYQRGIAIGLKLAGAKSKDIQVDLNISRGALRSTLSLDQLRNQGVSQPQIGAPKLYIEAEE